MATNSITVRKAPAGVQDLNFDLQGVGAQETVPTSSGGFRTIEKINASHIPITVTTRNKKGADNVTVEETDVDTALQAIFDELVKIGIPDGTTVEFSLGVLRIKDAGVTTIKIADNSITNIKLTDNAVGATKIAAGAVTTAKLDAAIGIEAVTTAVIRDNAVTTAKISDAAVTNSKILDASIKAAKFLDIPTHFIVGAEEIVSTTTGTSLIFTTATTLGVSDIIQTTVKSLGVGPNYVKTVQRSGANQITAVIDTAQSSGTTTLFLTVFRAVTP